MTIRLIASVFIVGLATLVAGQPEPPDGRDENPQNPLNWEALPNIVKGEDNASRQEYELINNVWQQVTANYYRDWKDMIWYRNGNSMGGGEFTIPFSTSVPNSSVSMSSEGEVTMRLRWKPTTPAPTSVRVKVT